jgi:pimeloyl-ACP methyl ester carboxylesterase
MTNEKAPRAHKTIVLVHSAWLGAWQWHEVKQELEGMGHKVITPDLPGHGNDTTPASKITMATYVHTLLGILDKEEQPVVLAGHSFNGITISQVAELRPNKIEKLVYITAFLLNDGASFFQAVDGVNGSEAVDNFYLSADQTQALVIKEAMHSAFAHDLPLEAFEAAVPNIVAEPAAPLSYQLSISNENFGQIPKYYIECTEDRAIPIGVQRAMHNNKVKEVFCLHSSHTPNFSKPKELAAILDGIASKDNDHR